jgi:hypothetical protein
LKKETLKAVKSCLQHSTSLTETAVLQAARSRVAEFLPLKAEGYSCTTGQLLDVLLAVSAQKDTIEQVCADLQIKVGAETIRGYFNEQLQVENLPSLQEAVNRALQKSLSRDVKGQSLEVAIDFHDQPYYGKTEQAEGLLGWRRSEKRDDENVSGSDGLCYQKRTSADIGNQIRAAGRKCQRGGRVFAFAVANSRDTNKMFVS